MAKPQKQPDEDSYLINTPIEEMIDDGTVSFVGESERDRMVSIMRFTRVRNAMVRLVNGLSRDEFADLLIYIKQFVVVKKE